MCVKRADLCTCVCVRACVIVRFPGAQTHATRPSARNPLRALSSACRRGRSPRAVAAQVSTYWQSDGTLPHSIALEFPRRMALSYVCLHVDARTDESYTPEKITVRAGTTWQDLEEVVKVELQEPSGWVVIPLRSRADPAAAAVRAYLLVVEIHMMQQNGRDTHVRQVKVLSPRPPVGHSLSGVDYLPFETTELAMHADIR